MATLELILLANLHYCEHQSLLDQVSLLSAKPCSMQNVPIKRPAMHSPGHTKKAYICHLHEVPEFGPEASFNRPICYCISRNNQMTLSTLIHHLSLPLWSLLTALSRGNVAVYCVNSHCMGFTLYFNFPMQFSFLAVLGSLLCKIHTYCESAGLHITLGCSLVIFVLWGIWGLKMALASDDELSHGYNAFGWGILWFELKIHSSERRLWSLWDVIINDLWFFGFCVS